MSAWIFIIGLVLLWVGVSSRLARRERRSLELAALDYPIKVATFWGRDLFSKGEARRVADPVSQSAAQVDQILRLGVAAPAGWSALAIKRVRVDAPHYPVGPMGQYVVRSPKTGA